MIRMMILMVVCWMAMDSTAQRRRDFLEGYVVLNSGDTLYGRVRDRKDGFNDKLLDRIIFKGEKGRERYWPDQLQAYHRGGFDFHSLPFSMGNDILGLSRINVGQKHFLKVLISGHMSLYLDEFVDPDGPDFDGNFYLIRKGELTFTQVSLLFFRKRMVPYFKDAPHLADAIEQKQYRYRDLINLVSDYNQWYAKEGML